MHLSVIASHGGKKALFSRLNTNLIADGFGPRSLSLSQSRYEFIGNCLGPYELTTWTQAMDFALIG